MKVRVEFTYAGEVPTDADRREAVRQLRREIEVLEAEIKPLPPDVMALIRAALNLDAAAAQAMRPLNRYDSPRKGLRDALKLFGMEVP